MLIEATLVVGCFENIFIHLFSRRSRNGVSKQLLDNWYPFVLHIHCYGYKFNLVVKTLSELEVVVEIGDLVKVIHAFFGHSPKKYIEFHFLVLLMETKGLKLLKFFCTRSSISLSSSPSLPKLML